MKPQAQGRLQSADTRAARPRRVEVIVVSSDDGFLIELGPILGERYRTRPVDQPAAIEAATDAQRWLAIVDATSLPDARAAVARMEQQYRTAPIIVIANSPSDWSAALSRGAIIAAIARDELAGSRLSEALVQAEARLRAEEASAAAAAPSSKPGTRKPATPLAVALAAALALAVAGGAWWWHSSRGASVAASHADRGAQATGASDAGTPAVAKAQSVEELLSAARVAFRDQKSLLPRVDGEPRGDSALELYIQVLAQDPDNEEALDGVKRLFAVGRSRVQADLNSGKLDDAMRLVGYFKSAGVNPDALRELESSISAAKPKWLASRAQESIAAGDFNTAEQLITQLAAAGADRNSIADLRRAIDAKKLDQQLASMAGEVKAAIDAGALLDPANDNARTRLAAMRNLGRNHPATLAAQRDVQAALLSHAQDATRKEQFDVAQRYIAAAADIGATAEAADAKRQLQSEMDLAAQRAAAAAAEAKAKEAALASAQHASAGTAAPPSATPQFIAARPLAPLKVIYPETAANNNVQGYVTVEFTLHPDGSASDVSVFDAKPAKIFNHSATDAVAHGRYDTAALLNNKPMRARIRLTFKPG